MNRSQQIFSEAEKIIPGGVNSPVRSFNAIGIDPIVFERGDGAFLFDVDGRRFVDFCCSWGALIHGHASRQVIDAIVEAAGKGTSFGANCEGELQLARLIVDSIPSIDKIRFVNSGTEAVMSAIRLARAFTGRNTIIKFDGCYHGHADHLLVSAGSGVATLNHSSSAGVPDAFVSHTISIPFNDTGSVQAVFDRQGNDIAAIIVEPVPANMGVILPQPGFLQFLRDITRSHGALLIFDEVITGFRLGPAGAQGLYGIDPDLTTLGKIIGGGLPVGAYGGRTEIMNLTAPIGPVYQAGTLSGNPLAMAAGIASLKLLQEEGFYQKLQKQADTIYKDFFVPLLTDDMTLVQYGSMFTIFARNNAPQNFSETGECDFSAFNNFYKSMLNRGIYLSPSQYETSFISSQHD